MGEQLNWFADFLGDFPKPIRCDEPPEQLPGRELAELIADGLRNRQFAVHSIETYDIEHVIRCSSGRREFRIHVWVDDISRIERWEVCCPSSSGWLARLLGRSDYEEHKRILEAIDDILKSSSRVHDIRWFRYYESPWLRGRCPRFAGPVGTAPPTPPTG